jgi:hypothetical protein
VKPFVCSVATVLSIFAGAQATELPTLGGRLRGYTIVRFDDDSAKQDPELSLLLYGEQTIFTRWHWYVSVLGQVGGTFTEAPGAGFVNYSHSFQSVSPSFEFDEAYLDYRGDTLDLRLGLQRFSWGRLDGTQPNDLLNPRDFNDPLVMEPIEQKIPVPAVSLSYYFPSSWRDAVVEEPRLDLVWEPIAVPWRMPLIGERWFPPIALVPDTISVVGVAGPVRLTESVANSPPPARQLDNGNFGARVGGRALDVDWAVTYYDGFDIAPSFDVAVGFPPGTVFPPGGVPADPVATVLLPAYERFRSVGLDLAGVVGGATVRAEGAFRFRRPYPFVLSALADELAQDEDFVNEIACQGCEPVVIPAFAKRDAIEWGVGVDYLVEGFLPLLELYQVIIVHNDQPLVYKDVDTRLSFNLRKTFLSDRLESQILVLWGIESGYEAVRAQATYAITDSLEINGGVLGIWGSRNSLIGEFQRNSEAFFRLEFNF